MPGLIKDIKPYEWHFAEIFFSKYEKEPKLKRKIKYPVSADDPCVKFYLEQKMITQEQIDGLKSVGSIDVLKHSFLKVTGGDVFALQVGKYLGKGGFGKVKLAQNVDGDNLAVKIEGGGITDKAAHQAEVEILAHLGRFKGETKRALQQSQAWLSRGSSSTKIYTAQMLIPGTEMTWNIDDLKDADAKLLMALGACLAIKQLHQNNIIHGDIKPQNFMTNLEQDLLFVYALDFGLSTKLRKRQSTIKRLSGTPDYMAPEVGNFERDVRGNVKYKDSQPILLDSTGQQSFASDIYSLGVVLKILGLQGDVIQKMLAQDRKERPSLDIVIDKIVKQFSKEEFAYPIVDSTKTEATLPPQKIIAMARWMHLNGYKQDVDYTIDSGKTQFSIVDSVRKEIISDKSKTEEMIVKFQQQIDDMNQGSPAHKKKRLHQYNISSDEISNIKIAVLKDMLAEIKFQAKNYAHVDINQIYELTQQKSKAKPPISSYSEKEFIRATTGMFNYDIKPFLKGFRNEEKRRVAQQVTVGKH